MCQQFKNIAIYEMGAMPQLMANGCEMAQLIKVIIKNRK